MVELKRTTCTLRPWKPGDEESLVAHANNRKIWVNVRDTFPHPYTLDSAFWWINHGCKTENRYNLAIDIDGHAVGGIGLVFRDDIYRKSAELGYWLGEKFWGRGIATDAVRGLTAFAFGRFDLIRIYAGVFETNKASSRVLEKAGFAYEGRLRKHVLKDGNMLDELVYARLRDESGTR